MKINEVVTEAGLMRSIGNYLAPGVVNAYDKVKGGLSGMKPGGPGFKAGSQAAIAGTQQQKQIEQAAKTALQKWSAYAQTLKTAGGEPSPADAVQWFASWSKTPADKITPPESVELAKLNPWLTKQIANYLALKQLGQTPTQTQTAPTAPSIGALGKRGSAAPTQQPAALQPNSEADIASMVKIKQQEPIILTYKNKEYALNDQGQWTPLMAANRPLSQAAQALFDKVAGFDK